MGDKFFWPLRRLHRAKRHLTNATRRNRPVQATERGPLAHLRSERGESLVESIVAIAVIVVILIAFAAVMNLGVNLTGQTTQLDSDITSPMSSTSQTAQYTLTDESGNQVSSGTIDNIEGNAGGIYRYDISQGKASSSR